MTPGQKVIGKLLHSAHLEVDGQRTEEPFYEAHFIAYDAGEQSPQAPRARFSVCSRPAPERL
ncbi:hypothetical protein MHPYR_30055 [uncultured Mycobacterium sp.]|uniref:Uncharacterized protein n=1 Tax=uncultured Mycobacterium sp. TaxID=171292 RepID=A0A1Y5PJJ7_9MYCO|nr:hypothetical protein MHPYR_30055 [uncultured Mycobacterium sp.]